MSPILSFILNKLQEKSIISPFVIVHWSWVNNQWSAIRELCNTATDFFAYHDVLEIKDYSELLGKTHTLKVEFKKNEDTDFLNKQEWYEDKGAREINDWLSYAPAGDMKILLIEHIDRATVGSLNALLKSFEEPLPNRMIIASTINKDMILPTILSRALLINCDSEYIPALLDDEWKKLLSDIIWWLETKDIAVLTKGAAQIAKSNYTRECIENLIYHYNIQEKYKNIKLCIMTLRMISSNVSAEHSIFKLFLEIIKD